MINAPDIVSRSILSGNRQPYWDLFAVIFHQGQPGVLDEQPSTFENEKTKIKDNRTRNSDRGSIDLKKRSGDLIFPTPFILIKDFWFI
jgi:hypothetical protein